MTEVLCSRIKAIVADTYISYDNITGAQAFDLFVKQGGSKHIHIAVCDKKVKDAYIKEEMSDLFDVMASLFEQERL